MHHKFLAVGILAATISVPAMAQQSLLSNLLGKLKQASSSNATSSTGLNIQGQPNDLVEILQNYAANSPSIYAYTACRAILNDDAYATSQAKLRLGEYGMATAGFLMHASEVAACAVSPEGISQVERIPLPQAFDGVGASLAMAVISSKLDNAVLPQTSIQAKDAMALLAHNASANAELIANLKETGLVGDPAPTTVSSASAIGLTAKGAVAAFNSNTFAFKSKYDGKVLEITGVVQNISGSGQRATVTLVGYKPANMDDQGFQHLVRCVVSDPRSLPKVMELKVGKSTKVTGLFKPDTQSFSIGIELQRCKVG